jgi:hypothetical protein
MKVRSSVEEPTSAPRRLDEGVQHRGRAALQRRVKWIEDVGFSPGDRILRSLRLFP